MVYRFQNVYIVFAQNAVGPHWTGHDRQESVKTYGKLSWFFAYCLEFVVSINLQCSVCALKNEL